MEKVMKKKNARASNWNYFRWIGADPPQKNFKSQCFIGLKWNGCSKNENQIDLESGWFCRLDNSL